MLDLTALKQAVDAKAIPALKTDRQISQVRFSPCGKFLLAAGHDALVHRWDMTGEQPLPLKPMAGHQGWVQSVVCRAAGELMLTADSWGQLRCGRFLGEDPAAVWTVPQAHDGWITGVALSPDGETAVTVGIDRTVHRLVGDKWRKAVRVDAASYGSFQCGVRDRWQKRLHG